VSVTSATAPVDSPLCEAVCEHAVELKTSHAKAAGIKMHVLLFLARI
jgi:hypothetical protein